MKPDLPDGRQRKCLDRSGAFHCSQLHADSVHIVACCRFQGNMDQLCAGLCVQMQPCCRCAWVIKLCLSLLLVQDGQRCSPATCTDLHVHCSYPRVAVLCSVHNKAAKEGAAVLQPVWY